jgi:hypothetical protein
MIYKLIVSITKLNARMAAHGRRVHSMWINLWRRADPYLTRRDWIVRQLCSQVAEQSLDIGISIIGLVDLMEPLWPPFCGCFDNFSDPSPPAPTTTRGRSARNATRRGPGAWPPAVSRTSLAYRNTRGRRAAVGRSAGDRGLFRYCYVPQLTWTFGYPKPIGSVPRVFG